MNWVRGSTASVSVRHVSVCGASTGLGQHTPIAISVKANDHVTSKVSTRILGRGRLIGVAAQAAARTELSSELALRAAKVEQGPPRVSPPSCRASGQRVHCAMGQPERSVTPPR